MLRFAQDVPDAILLWAWLGLLFEHRSIEIERKGTKQERH